MLTDKTRLIDEVYGQIDQLYEAQTAYDSDNNRLSGENAEMRATVSRLEVANCEVMTEKTRLEAEVGQLKADAELTRGQL